MKSILDLDKNRAFLMLYMYLTTFINYIVCIVTFLFNTILVALACII